MPEIIYNHDPGQTFTKVMGSSFTYDAFITANEGIACRFVAETTKDIKSVILRFGFPVTTPGTITLRIETVDATSGKPSGTLYDANATVSFTPTSDSHTATFSTLPTTGLTVGTEYCIVLIKDDAGTACTVVRVNNAVTIPASVLTAADGTTRSNFSEIDSTLAAVLVYEDDEESTCGMSNACQKITTAGKAYGADVMCAQKFVIAQDVTVRGIWFGPSCLRRPGTPAGDLRIRILTTSNTTVSGAEKTVDKDTLASANEKGARIIFDSSVSLAAGTYRICLDSASSVDASNCFGLNSARVVSANAMPADWRLSTTTNASSSWTWTDDADESTSVGLILSELPSGGGGGGGGRQGLHGIETGTV